MLRKTQQSDKLTKEERSLLMSKVRSKNTKPELIVRKLIHKNGYRYSLHRKDLPGSPDVVLPSRKKIIFIHGCFWHRHAGCNLTTTPRTRLSFWQSKFEANVKRDKRNVELLNEMGWKVIVVWGCDTKKLDILRAVLLGFLQDKVEEFDTDSSKNYH